MNSEQTWDHQQLRANIVAAALELLEHGGTEAITLQALAAADDRFALKEAESESMGNPTRVAAAPIRSEGATNRSRSITNADHSTAYRELPLHPQT